jgi:hypothetical protein
MQVWAWFSNNKYIDIQLFDNSVCTKWFNHFRPYSLEKYYGGGVISDLTQVVPQNNQQVETQWNFILNAIYELTKIGFTIPFQIPAVCDYNQSTLNLLHRFFTYNALWYWDSKSDSLILNPFDKNFKLPDDMSYEVWLGIIDPINSAVHLLDKYMSTDNKKFCSVNMPISTVEIGHTHRSPTTLSPWLGFSKEEQQYNYTYLDYELPLVMLNPSILGKCVLQSFLEDDDLNAKDCTGRLGSYGGFYIDLNSNRKKIYQSSQFKNWIEKHNRSVDNLPLEFPIGYVKNYQDIVSWLGPKIYFKNLEFVD